MRLLHRAWNVQISAKARALVAVLSLGLFIGLLITEPALVDHASEESVFVKFTAAIGIVGIVAGVSSVSKWMRDRGIIR
ncbi:hypothetical protein FHW92_004931 [Novosphingobium sp. SG707]|nr:hypothetical protein [Novosphingobium sp. SG707]